MLLYCAAYKWECKERKEEEGREKKGFFYPSLHKKNL
jgi:hypothetical protein